MRREFSRAVDPVFLYVLELMERINRGVDVVANEERTQIMSRIDQAETLLHNSDVWQSAKYGLVAWVDEMFIIDVAWSAGTWWDLNKLEWHYFKTNDRYTEFYVRAKKAMELPRKDALEVYYVCVVLGFRGLYRDANGRALTGREDLPPDLESWARGVAKVIQLGQGRPPIEDRPAPGDEAPPLENKERAASMVLACLTLLAVDAFLIWFWWFGGSTRGD
jgi:type VI secretion system protein ImpK